MPSLNFVPNVIFYFPIMKMKYAKHLEEKTNLSITKHGSQAPREILLNRSVTAALVTGLPEKRKGKKENHEVFIFIFIFA